MRLEPLLNRDSEVEALRGAWQRAVEGRPQLAVIWGRRRVGKTFLLSHFVADKRSVLFAATQQAEGVELRRLHEAAVRDLGADVGDLAGGGFANWEAALRYFAATAREKPLVVVLDEFPYLTRSTPGLASVVQAVWDHLPRGARLLLVLTGSAVGAVESMLGPHGALRGRPTLTMRLDPLDVLAARAFLPKLGPVAFLEAYAACGGYPLHLAAWDQEATTRANLIRLAASAGGLLLDDAWSILHEELPDAPSYPKILTAIGRGRTRISEIRSDADQRVEHPLSVLVRSGLVRRTLPVGAPRRARPLYEIEDVYLAFWFTVLASDRALVEAGQGRAVLSRRQPQWERHIGWLFEEQARAHAVRLVSAGHLPAELVVGRWWTSSGEPCEVDVLGLEGSRTALLGEARWRSRAVTMREIRKLMAKTERVPRPVAEPLYVVWSRGGAKPDVRRAGVLTFEPDDMLSQ